MGAEKAATNVGYAGHDPVNGIVSLRGLSSEELAGRAKCGCQASFAELVRRYAPRLQAFLCRRNRNDHEVEDLVQDTLFKAYQNLDRYDDSWRFSTWLFTIAGRVAVSRHRRKQLEPGSLDLQAHAPAPDEIADQREQQESLWAIVAELPAGQYRALWLRYGEDMSVKEIAAAMGKSQVWAKVSLYRARMSLARRLNERPEGWI
jgi:RNA polymerase sigma-70 factor (ECF subfamily)